MERPYNVTLRDTMFCGLSCTFQSLQRNDDALLQNCSSPTFALYFCLDFLLNFKVVNEVKF